MADRSYRALLEVPSVARLLLGMQIARIGQQMVSVAFVLFALATYQSSALAGLVAFFSLFPGLVVSPIAGALLDRHGRTRLVVLDYLVALLSLTVIGILALAGLLPPWLLIVIAAIASLTMPLSGTGVRSLLPLIVPAHLWERVNAIDSMGYVLATIVGPPLSAFLVSWWGGAVAFIVIGLSYGLAAIVIAGAHDPFPHTAPERPLMTSAWEGLVYTWRNPTLRGLGLSLSALNLSSGTLNIVVPLVVLRRLQLDETMVGVVFALHGATAIVSALFFGRHDTRNREWIMLVAPMFGWALSLSLLYFNTNLGMLILVMSITGLLNGPLDIALFTVRQRRTDTAWTGRAFAISMSFNAMGLPVGAAMAGFVAARSIEAAIALGVVACVIATALAAVMIPARD